MSGFPDPDRYEHIDYRRCGASGLMLPRISLGLWHNFGQPDCMENSRKMVRTAFDLGITHFDLANNYGPPPGAAETTFSQILTGDLAGYRDELVISTKAGYYMWPGPYGDHGSRKYLVASLDQSLKRMGIDYVDIFYHHRPDPETPMEETMAALADIVQAGKALYVGVSSYSPEQTRQASEMLRDMGTSCLIHQPGYSMFSRWIEDGLLDVLEDEGIGCIAFSCLAQGMLTDKYLSGIPDGSRAAKAHGFLKAANITEDKLAKISALNDLAAARSQSLAQMSIAWVLRHEAMTSALIGASRSEQITEIVMALDNLDFTDDELDEIDSILAQ